jgi:hypothetical protein
VTREIQRGRRSGRVDQLVVAYYVVGGQAFKYLLHAFIGQLPMRTPIEVLDRAELLHMPQRGPRQVENQDAFAQRRDWPEEFV